MIKVKKKAKHVTKGEKWDGKQKEGVVWKVNDLGAHPELFPPARETNKPEGPTYKRTINDYGDMIENLVDLCKCRFTREWEHSFPRIFLNRKFNMADNQYYTDREEAIEDMKYDYCCYDDEDIRQDILMVMWEKKFFTKFRGAPYRVRGVISRAIRDRLINQVRFWRYTRLDKIINSLTNLIDFETCRRK